jgi:hypothetical protein
MLRHGTTPATGAILLIVCLEGGPHVFVRQALQVIGFLSKVIFLVILGFFGQKA